MKQRLEQTPEANIPELKLLSEEDWLDAVRDSRLESEKDYRRALGSLRTAGQHKFAAMAQPALDKYLKANNWSFPTDLSQVQPYFESASIDEAILQRWAVLPASSVENVKMGGEWIISQKSAVDEEFDQRIVVGPNGRGSASYPSKDAMTISKSEEDSMAPVLKAYSAANNGHEPIDPSQLQPYITTPEQQAVLDKSIHARAPKGSPQP